MSRRLFQPDSVQADIDRLELPPSLEPIGGAIRLAGHRVSLVQVLDAIFDGTSTERMREMFPTIPAWKPPPAQSGTELHTEIAPCASD
jgi:hypothetical protein